MALNSKYKIVILNFIGGLSIFFVLILLRLPILLNADSLLGTDEALMAFEILELYNGGPLFFYYSVTTYFGILNGLAAFPFFKILGVGSLAFKLPAILFYALFILSSYWLVKKIEPQAALTVVLLMIFTSPAVWHLTITNYGVGLICFLGNLIFLSFCKIKETGGSKVHYVFLFGFFSGLAIYSFTYSIVYIGSVAILFCLSNNYWETFRERASLKSVGSWFTEKKNGIQKVKAILDSIILIFIPIVLFSYIFGGFGIDIGHYSILQSNELHKPLGQLLVLIVIRVCLFRKDLNNKFNLAKRLFQTVDPLIRRSGLFGILGFTIGISPRLFSILEGSIKKGGQGFDVDFIPTNLVFHFWQLITYYLPDLLGLREPITQFFIYNFQVPYIINLLFATTILCLLCRVTIFFVAPRWEEVKKIFKLKRLIFNPAQFFLILPILICSAVIVSQGPPAVRYLFPLQGVFCVWTAIYLIKIRQKSKILFAFSLVVWCMFSTIGIYKYYSTIGVIQNFSIVERPNPYINILNFCEKNKISHAYSDYATSVLVTFFSKGNLKMAEYTKNVMLGKIKKRLAKEDRFAVIINGERNDLASYQKFLKENIVSYSKNILKGNNKKNNYYIFSNFNGDAGSINQLRSLIVH